MGQFAKNCETFRLEVPYNLFLNRVNLGSVAQVMVNLPRTVQTKIVSDTAKEIRKQPSSG